MRSNSFASAGGVHALVGLALDTDASGVDAHGASEVGAHGVDVRRHLRCFGNDNDVDIDHDMALVVHDFHRSTQQIQARRVLVTGVGVGEVTTDVSGTGGAWTRR